FAGGWLLNAGDELHEGCLAGERAAQKHVECPILQHQAGLVNMGFRANALGHIPELKGHVWAAGLPATLELSDLCTSCRGAPAMHPGYSGGESPSLLLLVLGPALDQLVIGDGLAL